jgi:hypothetical protein
LVQLQPKSGAHFRQSNRSRECPDEAFNKRRSSLNIKTMEKPSCSAQRATFSEQLQNDKNHRLADRNSNGRWMMHSTSFQIIEDEKSPMCQHSTCADMHDGWHSTQVVAFFTQVQLMNGMCFCQSSRLKMHQGDAADRECSKPNVLHWENDKKFIVIPREHITPTRSCSRGHRQAIQVRKQLPEDWCAVYTPVMKGRHTG